MTVKTCTARLVLAAAAVALGSPARAGLIPDAVSNVAEGSDFRWTYSIVLPTDMQLKAGNQFTVYDFGGFKAGSAMVTATGPDASYAKYWTFSSANLGPTPARLNPQDDPTIPNLTWTYTGPTINTGGQITLGNFSADSSSSQGSNSFLTASNPRASDGVIDSNITQTTVPLGSGGTTATTPEPATLALAGLGLPFVGAARLLRRKRTA